MNEYIQQLLLDAGLPPETDAEVRDQLIADLIQRANDHVNRKVIDAMSSEDAQAFDQLLDSHGSDVGAIQQFVQNHVPNVQEITAKALIEFRALYLGSAA
ncbi:MAG: DUF5663 domain-containing protein [Patescibacteria group bacterium]|nr:DUF5663 domain-containing protein [Patescibacteria group bacterium]